MNEIFKLIERDFPNMTAVVRHTKGIDKAPKGFTYMAMLYEAGANPFDRHTYKAYANVPSEALSMVYHSATNALHINQRKAI